MNIWPRLRGLAGPAPLPDPEPEPERPEPVSDTHLQLMGVPADDDDVSNSSHLPTLLFDGSRYQDPLHTLSEYIAEVSITVGSPYLRIPL